MYKAKLYSNANQLQKREILLTLKAYSNIINYGDCKTLLDVGCGVGNILAEDLQNLMPDTYDHLIGIDLSEKMIEFAKTKYETDKIKFFQRDISNFKEIEGMTSFDHITSFFCLNWIRNQRKALEQINKLLNPGGDFLSITIGWCSLFEFFTKMSTTEKWGPYFFDISKFRSVYFEYQEPEKKFKLNLEETGFHSIITDYYRKYFRYENLTALRNFFEAINPSNSRLTLEMRNELFKEFCQREQLEVDSNEHNRNSTLNFHFSIIVAYAKK